MGCSRRWRSRSSSWVAAAAAFLDVRKTWRVVVAPPGIDEGSRSGMVRSGNGDVHMKAVSFRS
jgi:hypothetical protein